MRFLWALMLGCSLFACGGGDEGGGGAAKTDGGATKTDGGGGGGGAVTKLTFTAIPDQNTTELKTKYEPVAKYLSDTLGIEVEYVPVNDYQASVRQFKLGAMQLAWFGGLTGVQACAQVPGAKIIAMGAEDKEFVSYFIANKSTGLEPSDEFPEAIKSLKFTFGSNGSTSGRLMPENYIIEHTGKTAEEFFEHTPNFSGSHDKTVELVDSGQFEAGVLNYTVYDKHVEAGGAKNCVIIWKTPTYADYNFAAHPSLGEDLINRLQAALVAMPEDLVQSAFKRSKMIKASNADFAGIEAVAKKLGMLDG